MFTLGQFKHACIVLTMLFVIVPAGAMATPPSSPRVINVKTATATELETISKAGDGASTLVLFVPANTPMTMNLSIKGDLMELEGQNSVKILFKKDIFARVSSSAPEFSLDGKAWKSFREFATGNISFGVGADKSQTSPVLNFSMQVNGRSKK